MDIAAQLKAYLRVGVVAVAPERADAPIELERPKQPQHGDFASNIALHHAKALKRNPREFAQALLAALPASKLVEKIEIAGAGFINIFLTHAARQAGIMDATRAPTPSNKVVIASMTGSHGCTSNN